jgi:glutamyl-tRNA reductase
MQVQKIIHITEEEIHSFIQKYVEKKVKGIVEKVEKTAEGLALHVSKTALEETPSTTPTKE